MSVLIDGLVLALLGVQWAPCPLLKEQVNNARIVMNRCDRSGLRHECYNLTYQDWMLLKH